MFADRSDTVMARAAGPQYLCVVDSKGRRPHIRIVAILTDIGCQNMCCALTRCFDTVVTTYAVTRDIKVIEIRGQPGDRGMTIITIVAARNVCRILAGRGNSVMTGAARSQDLSVIDSKHWHPDV